MKIAELSPKPLLTPVSVKKPKLLPWLSKAWIVAVKEP
jgi:hypothetical protein